MHETQGYFSSMIEQQKLNMPDGISGTVRNQLISIFLSYSQSTVRSNHITAIESSTFSNHNQLLEL
jgi:hypothetical protein